MFWSNNWPKDIPNNRPEEPVFSEKKWFRSNNQFRPKLGYGIVNYLILVFRLKKQFWSTTNEGDSKVQRGYQGCRHP